MVIPLPSEELQLGVGLETGAEYLGFGLVVKDAVLRRTGLEHTGSVLDIGCGSGRVARHFVDYTRTPGRYVGMDIQKPFIDWCTEHLSPANERLEFYHQDIFNGAYNPGGTYKASEYRFPFEDESFDVIILYSVFTHLLPEDAENYLREVARLLKPGGYCYSTWFLMTRDAEVEYLLPNIREGQVGYGFIRCVDVLESAGLRIDGSQLGKWNGAESGIWQDLLWLRRAADVPTPFQLEDPIEVHETEDHSTISGTLERLDPISHCFTMVSENGSRLTINFSRRVAILAHGRPSKLTALKVGQRIKAGCLEMPSGHYIASRVAARGQLKAELLRGTIEAVDWETKLITLSIIGEDSVRLKFDPAQTPVKINGQDSKFSELRSGQTASIKVVPMVQAVAAREHIREAREPFGQHEVE